MIKNLSTDELTQYLKKVAELEASVYRQEISRANARKTLRRVTPRKSYIEPPKNTADSIKTPIPPEPSTEKRALTSSIFFFILGVAGFALGSVFLGAFLIAGGAYSLWSSFSEKNKKS